MLSRTVQPRLCGSCRSELLRLFACGLGSAVSLQKPWRKIYRSRDIRSAHNKNIYRSFATTAGLHDAEELPSKLVQDEPDLVSSVEAVRDADGSIEDIVREARQQHGEYLPGGVLFENEYKTYRSLYGDPADPKTVKEKPAQDGEQQLLFDQHGEAIPYEEARKSDSQRGREDSSALETLGDNAAEEIDERTKEALEYVGGEIRPYEVDQNASETSDDKAHPMTLAGRFQTSPSTTFLPPNSFVKPIQKILSDFSNKHVKEMSERLFGGPGLPDSPLTPQIGRVLPQKPIPLDASQHGMGTMEANAYISVIWPSTYAAVGSILVETRKRLGSQWLRDLLTKEGGPSMLDAGGGGVAVLTWRDILRAEWETLHSSDPSPPPTPLGKSTVLTGADSLRHRATSLLEQTTFLPRLPDYVHVRDASTLADDRPANQRKQFDVIIAPHTLWPLKEEWQRKQQVQNLWSLLNPDGGVLILLEKGVPRGFEVIAGARDFLLERCIATADSPTYESRLESSIEEGSVPKGKGFIIAPCTNHVPCPMYPVAGVSRGRKNYCSFQQRYIRPPFLQRILGATDRNHDDVDFSYIAVQKGRDLQDISSTNEPFPHGKSATDSAFKGYEHVTEQDEMARVNTLTLPRLILPPLKRPGHVTMDVCTPAGQIDRWTVSKSFSRTAYQNARKSSWGDLWALGAKARVRRNLQLGGEHSKKAKSRHEKREEKAGRIHQQLAEEKEEAKEAEAEMERLLLQDEEAAGLDLDDVDTDIPADLRQEMATTRQTRKKITKKQTEPTATIKAQQASPKSSTSTNPLSNPSIVSHPLDSSSPPNPDPDPHLAMNKNKDKSMQPLVVDLDPQEAAQLRDHAAESRLDSIRSHDNSRLKGNAALIRRRVGRRRGGGAVQGEERGAGTSLGLGLGLDGGKGGDGRRSRRRERGERRGGGLEEEDGG